MVAAVASVACVVASGRKHIYGGRFRKKVLGIFKLRSPEIVEIHGKVTMVAWWSQESNGGLKSRKVVARITAAVGTDFNGRWRLHI